MRSAAGTRQEEQRDQLEHHTEERAHCLRVGGTQLQRLQRIYSARFVPGTNAVLEATGEELAAYFRGDLVTSYELLQRRFGTSVKTAAAGIFLITRSLADGVRLFATALVIAVVTGVPVSWTVVVLGAAVLIGDEGDRAAYLQRVLLITEPGDHAEGDVVFDQRQRLFAIEKKENLILVI